MGSSPSTQSSAPKETMEAQPITPRKQQPQTVEHIPVLKNNPEELSTQKDTLDLRKNNQTKMTKNKSKDIKKTTPLKTQSQHDNDPTPLMIVQQTKPTQKTTQTPPKPESRYELPQTKQSSKSMALPKRAFAQLQIEDLD